MPAGRLLAGRWIWLVPFLPLLYLAILIFLLLVGWRQESFTPAHAQGFLIGFPLTVLACFLGIRIIAGEVDRRTLEIAYTVPGGAHRIWISKLVAAFTVLLVSEAMLALVAVVFLTEFPMSALYGSMQAACFYMVLSMTLAAWSRSAPSGGLIVAAVLFLNGFLTGFGEAQSRLSPFWNPLVLERKGADAADITAWAFQNRIGFLLLIAAVIALGFARAERREKMLGR
jgi:hypothetical protein